MPACSPRCTSDSANGSAHSEDHRRPRTRAAMPTTTRRCVVGQRADQPRGPDEVRLLRRRARDADHEHDEDADEDHRVEERERALQRQRQRVERGEREERDLDRVRAVELRPRCRARPCSRCLRAMRVIRHAASSTTIDQPTPISSRLPPVMLASASGAYFSGSSPAFAREREVDRVLGQHRDEREHGEREALRHVELERLGRPGQEERRAEDGEPEHDRGHDVAEAGAR